MLEFLQCTGAEIEVEPSMLLPATSETQDCSLHFSSGSSMHAHLLKHISLMHLREMPPPTAQWSACKARACRSKGNRKLACRCMPLEQIRTQGGATHAMEFCCQQQLSGHTIHGRKVCTCNATCADWKEGGVWQQAEACVAAVVRRITAAVAAHAGCVQQGAASSLCANPLALASIFY